MDRGSKSRTTPLLSLMTVFTTTRIPDCFPPCCFLGRPSMMDLATAPPPACRVRLPTYVRVTPADRVTQLAFGTPLQVLEVIQVTQHVPSAVLHSRRRQFHLPDKSQQRGAG